MRRGEDEKYRAARADADVAREERKTEGEEVELTAITLYLHLAGFELHGRRRPTGASPPRTELPRVTSMARHVYAVLSPCWAAVGEGELGLLHCSRPGENSEVGADAPRPPPARVKLPKF